MAVATKLDRIVKHREDLTPIKSHDPLIARFYNIT